MVVINREEGKISYKTNKEEISILGDIVCPYLNDFIKLPLNIPKNIAMTYVISCKKQDQKINILDNNKDLNLKIEYFFKQVDSYKTIRKECFELKLNVETRKIEGNNTKKYFGPTEMNNLFIISKEK